MFGKIKEEPKCLKLPDVRGISEAYSLMGALDKLSLLIESQDYIAAVQAQRIPRPPEDEYKEFLDSVKELCSETKFDLNKSLDEDTKAYIAGLKDALHWIFCEEIFSDLVSFG